MEEVTFISLSLCPTAVWRGPPDQHELVQMWLWAAAHVTGPHCGVGLEAASLSPGTSPQRAAENLQTCL